MNDNIQTFIENSIFRETFIFHGWLPSPVALRPRQKLARAHSQILCLRLCRKVRQVPTEEQENICYARYAEVMDKIES